MPPASAVLSDKISRCYNGDRMPTVECRAVEAKVIYANRVSLR